MPPEQCQFRVSKEDFLNLPQSEQNSLIYSCLMDMQEKIDWKWKKIMGIGAIAGFIGGLFNGLVIKVFGLPRW